MLGGHTCKNSGCRNLGCSLLLDFRSWIWRVNARMPQIYTHVRATIQRKCHQALHPHQVPLPHPQAHQEFSGMSGIHDPHTLREESQWPDPFSFQIPSGSVKVTEKPMKRAGLWTLMDAVDVGKTFFFLFLQAGCPWPSRRPLRPLRRCGWRFQCLSRDQAGHRDLWYPLDVLVPVSLNISPFAQSLMLQSIIDPFCGL